MGSYHESPTMIRAHPRAGTGRRDVEGGPMIPTVRPKTLATWLTAVCAAAALSDPAAGAVLCARGSAAGVPNEGATVKVRTACKDNETSLDAASLGVFGGVTTTIVRTGNTINTNASLSSVA